MKDIKGILFLVVIIIALLAFIALTRCLTPEDTWICDNGTWVKHGHPFLPAPAKPCNPNPGNSAQTPESVLASFYDWHRQQGGNIIFNRSYQGNSLLSTEYKNNIDKLLAAPTTSGYDPFICAQKPPTSTKINTASVGGDTAWLIVEENFEGTILTPKVDFKKVSNNWLIDNITCPSL